MDVLEANTEEAAFEKHIPAVTIENGILTAVVGSVEHPMMEKHYIQMIALETENLLLIKELNPGDAPKAEFAIGNEKPVAVYEFCNLHGLWKAEL